MRVLPVLVALIALGTSTAAGFWQLDRERQKAALGQAIRAAETAPPHDLSDARSHLPSLLWRRVILHGRYLPTDTVYLDNRVHQGRIGYHIVTPFELADRRLILLIDRGWIPIGASRSELPVIATPSGILRVEGRLAPMPGKTLELARVDPSQPVWLNLDLDRFRQGRNLDPAPFVVQQSAPAEPGFVREWPAPNVGTDKHRAYAMQWFAMAIVALVFLAMFIVRGGRRATGRAAVSNPPATRGNNEVQEHDPH